MLCGRRVKGGACRGMGSGCEQLRLERREEGRVWGGVSFGSSNYLAEVCSPLDIVYNLEKDRWGGKERLRLNILDFKPTG